MPNPFEKTTSVFPDIVAGVNGAYESNKAIGQIDDLDSSAEAGKLGDISESEATAAREDGNLVYPGLDIIENPETKIKFESAFTNADRLFNLINLGSVSPEQLAAAGVDFDKLAASYEKMTAEGLEPDVVITPNLPLTKFISTRLFPEYPGYNWETLYEELHAITATPDSDDLEKTEIRLSIDEAQAKNADIFLVQETNFLKRNPELHSYTINKDTKLPLTWTIALLPGTRQSQKLGSSHNDYEQIGDTDHSSLPTMSQYLAWQAVAAHNECIRSDFQSFTWLLGYADGASKSAPCGDVISPNYTIRIAWRDIELGTSTSVGVRLPVWG